MLSRNDFLNDYQKVKYPEVKEVSGDKHIGYGPTILRAPKTIRDCRCWHCDRIKWPLLYKLYENPLDYRCWFEIPRSGSVTIKESHPERKHIQRSDPVYQELVENYKPHVIFTDPIDRFTSTVNAYFVEGGRYWGYGQHAFWYNAGVDIQYKSYEERWNLFFDNIDVLHSDQQVHHFHNQALYVDTKAFSEFQFNWKKDIGKAFDTEKHDNKTDYKITRDMFTPHQIEWLTNYYRLDYEFIQKHGS